MRGVHSAVDDIRRSVFTEVARLAYEGGDLNRVDLIPYQMIRGEVAKHRADVFLERAIVRERVRLALGMNLQNAEDQMPISATISEAYTDQKYFENPLVNIIPFACNACPPQAGPHHGQLPGLHLPPLHERLPQGCHLSRQEQALPHRPG